MSSLQMTPKQRAILGALSRSQERSNAQVADLAEVSENYASRVLRKLEKAGEATSRYPVQDADDPQTHYRLWRKK